MNKFLVEKEGKEDTNKLEHDKSLNKCSELASELPSDKKVIFLPPDKKSFLVVYPCIPKDIRVNASLFEELWNLHPMEKGKVKMAGKLVDTPRWQQSYGQSYYFSNMLHAALPIEHVYLQKLLKWVCHDSGNPYKMILLNWYESGDHYISGHSDDETQMVPNSAIYSFSFGQERDFVVKSKQGSFRKVFSMRNNSLIVMGGEMQKHYTHAVPKRALSKCPNRRINITMRLFKHGQL